MRCPIPKIHEPTDAIVRITSTAICGSDLHLYEVLAPFMTEGDILGHEPMGIVEEVGSGGHAHRARRPGRHPVQHLPAATASCATTALQSQCETTQVREQGKGAALFGYTKLYGQVPGGQAEYLRVPQAQYGPIKVPDGPPDERFLYLSDVLPTAWQAVEYADVPSGGTLAVLGLGPIGDMCRAASPCTAASARSSASTSSPSGSTLARARTASTIDRPGRRRRRRRRVRDLTDGRGPDCGDRRGRDGGARRADREADAEDRRPAARPGRGRS